MKKLAYVTGNQGKFEEACLVMAPIPLEQVTLDIQEIQGTSEEILEDKAKKSFALLKRPLIVEDVSFHLEALNGFPGPYIKSFLEQLGEEGLWNLISLLPSRKAATTCWAAYCEPHVDPLFVQGTIHGTIVEPKGGLKHGKFSYNALFLPAGETRTFGETSMAEHAVMSHRFLALQKIRAHLLETSFSHLQRL